VADKESTTKQLPTRPPRITWKAVEPRHYARAQEYLKTDGKGAYAAYIMRLVEAWDFAGSLRQALRQAQEEPQDEASDVSIPVTQPDALSREQRDAVIEAFEAVYGPAEVKKGD
jgi:hypothetical protein